MHLKVKDSNLFLLPGNKHMLHLGTIVSGLKEYVVLVCINGLYKGNCYIEEVVLTTSNYSEDITANCKFISDDNLAYDLAKFAEEQGLTDMKKRTNELIEQGNFKWLTS